MKKGDRVEIIKGAVKGVKGTVTSDSAYPSRLFVEVAFDTPFVFEGQTYTNFPFCPEELQLIDEPVSSMDHGGIGQVGREKDE